MKFTRTLWILSCSLILTVAFLLILAYQQAWKYHLEVDIWGFYYPRLIYFLENFSFANFGANEYFPGTMFFFLIPGLSFLIGSHTWQTYLVGLFTTNIILITIHLYIYKKHHYLAPFVFLCILIFAGPIILYRHDLLVSLFVLTSLMLWRNNKFYLALFVLGIASSIKIYPLLILPLFVMGTIKDKNYQKIIPNLALFLLGVTSILLPYLLLGSSISDILEPTRVNSIKPVGVESLWGSFLTLINRGIEGSWPVGKGAHGVFGIAPQDTFLPLVFYNYFWVIPSLFFYGFIYSKLKFWKTFQTEIVFLTILLFLIFSKILAPQYIFWIITLLPLFNLHQNISRFFGVFFILILIIVLISQFIYPLHYNELLGQFYSSGARSEFFYLLLLRNILLVVLFMVVFRHIFSYASPSHEKDLST